MVNEYIRREDAVDALAKTMPTPTTPDGVGDFDHEIHIADEALADAIRIIESLEPADVISKADLITLLEQTEKDITKGVEESPTGMMIKSVFGVIKCKVNMMGEKTDD